MSAPVSPFCGHLPSNHQVDNIQAYVIALSCVMCFTRGKSSLIDATADGLEIFHMKSAISAFPELFKELFVGSDACSPSDVLSILHFDQYLGPEEQRVAGYLKNAIQQLSETGVFMAVQFGGTIGQNPLPPLFHFYLPRTERPSLLCYWQSLPQGKQVVRSLPFSGGAACLQLWYMWKPNEHLRSHSR